MLHAIHTHASPTAGAVRIRYMALRLVLVVVAWLHITGCTTIQPLPLAGRAGDTIMLSVGSPEGMTTENTSVAFVSAADPANPIDVTVGIRSISKIYPDKTSGAWLTSLARSVSHASGHGPWLIVMVLDLPSTLPVGPGEFHVSTTSEVVYPAYSSNVNEVPISFEILPGTGESHQFTYRPWSSGPGTTPGDLAQLDPLPQVLISPPAPPQPDGSENQVFGAVEIKLNVPVRTPTGAVMQTGNIVVVQDDQPGNIISQVQMSWSRSGDDFTIHFISPAGGMSYYQAKCSIVAMVQNADATTVFPIQPVLTSVRYFDANGVVTTGPLPSLAVR